MSHFRFTDEERVAVRVALGNGVAHKFDGGAMADIEGVAAAFVGMRGKFGKDIPSPVAEAKAWFGVVAAAEALRAAIGEVLARGLAEHTVLDPRRAENAAFAARLDALAVGCAFEARIAPMVREPASKNSDPARDRFVFGLIDLWSRYGKHVGASVDDATGNVDGPLVRFLQSVTGPAFSAVGEDEISAAALRALIRKFKDMASLAG